MNRKILLIIAVSLCLWGGAHAASVGVLLTKSSAMYNAPLSGIKSVLGADVLVLDMQGDASNGPKHCATFKSSGVKAVMPIGKAAVDIVRKNLPGMPIVFCMVMSPEESGLSGGDITGVSLDVPPTEQFKAFKSTVPTLGKIGLVYSASTAKSVPALKAAASKNGLTIVEKKVASDAEVPNAIREMKGQIDGLYLPPDRTVAKHDAFQFIALFTFENNLPFMAPTDRFVKKGALVALMIDYEQVGNQAARIAKKVVAGSSPGSIAIQPPEVTILVLNQKTASTIGINIPPSLLQGSKIIK